MELPLSLGNRNLLFLKDRAGLRRSFQFRKKYPFLHFLQKVFRNVPVHGHDILFLLFKAGPVDGIHQFSLIREKEKAFGILIETPNRINAFGILHILNDILPSVLLSCRANHSARLIVSKEYRFRLLPPFSLSGNPLSGNLYFFLSANLHPKACRLSVYLDLSFGNQSVRLSS